MRASRLHLFVLVALTALSGCTKSGTTEAPAPAPTPAPPPFVAGNLPTDYDYKAGLTIEDESRISKLQVLNGPVQIYAWGAGTDALRIRAVQQGQTFANSPFLLTIPWGNINPVTTSTGYQIGNFLIQPSATGYSLYQGGTFMYSSSFTVSGSTLMESRVTRQPADSPEYFMGMGDYVPALLKDGGSYPIYNYPNYGLQTNLFIPFICTASGKGFYYNAASNDAVSFSANGTGAFTYATGTGSIDSYYFKEAAPKDTIARFYSLSGSGAMLPKWAFGFIQSRYGYHNNAEVEGIVDGFSSRGIPLSAIVLDLYWFKNMGDLDWDYSNWDPVALHTYLTGKGVKLISITEPYVLQSSTNYAPFSADNTLVEDSAGAVAVGNIWLGDCGMIDVLAPSVMTSVGARYNALLADGVDGFWTDLGEPEADVPGAMFDVYDMTGFHNYYNREWSRIIHDAVAIVNPDHRVFNNSRSGFTGSGGYGVAHWSGDSSSTFDELARQIPLALNDGVAGFSYWGSDTGGFVGTPSDELFTRWYQFSSFVPVFRAHASIPREPWVVSGANYTAVVNYINQRYNLQPYIYSTAWQTYSAGIPMMRPLNTEFPSDSTLYGANAGFLNQEYLFGDSLLVAPVTAPGITSMQVYLPGSTWYRLSDFTAFNGGLQTLPITIADIPVFVRAGAIIPWSQARSGEADTIYLFPSDSPTSLVWYDDDGVSNEFKRGVYEAITITLDSGSVTFDHVQTAKTLTLNIMTNPAAATFSGKFTTQQVSLQPGSNTVTF